MPSTATNDLAPILPTALTGPFLVASAADAADYLQLDPAQARVAAVGAARPPRQLILPATSDVGAATASPLGSSLDARLVGANSDGGFHLAPFTLPADADLGEPCTVTLWVAPQTTLSKSKTVRLELAWSHAPLQAETHSDYTLIYDWVTPASWNPGTLLAVPLDAGAGSTFAAETFAAGELLGLRVRRIGSAEADTLDTGLRFLTAVAFDYRADRL